VRPSRRATLTRAALRRNCDAYFDPQFHWPRVSGALRGGVFPLGLGRAGLQRIFGPGAGSPAGCRRPQPGRLGVGLGGHSDRAGGAAHPVVGGVAADRHHLQAILRVGNALQALALVSIAALDHIGVLSVPDLYAFAIVYGALAAFTAPAADSLMPSLLPPELVRRAQLGSRTRGSWRTAMHPVSHAAMPRIFSTCSPPSTSGSTWYCYVPRSAARSKRRELLVSTRSTAHRPGSGRQTTRVSWRS
jgi:hypothetical protein